jgi:hypothetical protein
MVMERGLFFFFFFFFFLAPQIHYCIVHRYEEGLYSIVTDGLSTGANVWTLEHPYLKPAEPLL